MTTEELDLACWPIFYSMTKHGIAVDQAAMNKLRDEILIKTAELGGELFRLAPTLEPSKPRSVAAWMTSQNLFGKRTATGQLATGERDLAGFNNPVLNKVIEWRGLNKLVNTFIEPTLAISDQDPVENTTLGVVHPRWRLTKVRSGRVSMEEPNLLAFPSRDELGKKVRECFVPRPGHSFVSVDYSQLEPRIVAALSQDPTLLAIYRDGRDLYAETATSLSVTRTVAKLITLGVLYGMMAKRLQEQLVLAGCVAPDGEPLYSVEECERLIEKWFDTYPGVRKLVRDVVKEARDNGGYATTYDGRTRYLPAILLPGTGYPNGKLRQEAERQAFNHRIQGTGMEMLKRAMIRVDKQLGTLVQPVLAIHDELVYEVKGVYGGVGAGEMWAGALASHIESNLNGVALPTSSSHGPSWGSLK